MKIAVCLSGHMRSFRKTHESLFEHVARPGKHDGLDVDYFIHTWNEEGASGVQHDEPGKVLDVAEMLSVYHPASFCVETYNPETWPARSMFRKIMLAHGLVLSSRCDYDLCIRARPDSFFISRIPIEQFLAKDTVFVPSRAHFSGVCDQFAAGTTEAMTKYSSLFENTVFGDNFHPETRLKDHITARGLSIDLRDDIRFKIFRTSGLLYDTMSLGS